MLSHLLSPKRPKNKNTKFALAYSSQSYSNQLDDFNLSITNLNLKNCMSSFNLESLDSPTSYQSINTTCIDLILTKKIIL